MAPLCRQCPCGLFAYGCRCPDDREDNTYGLCAHVRRAADHQPRPLFAQPVCPRQRDYPHEGGQTRLLGVRYILIEYGAGHETTVQPVNEEAFMREVRDRQERISLNINEDEDKE